MSGASGAVSGNGTVVRCDVCPRGCALAPGAMGACRARANVGGSVRPTGYGRITSLAVDPVEKKPLARWRPGSTVLSLGGYGCNLHCPWCQNHTISQVGETGVGWREVSPEELVTLARRLHVEDTRMVGIAYTYNEPFVCWEFLRDAGTLAHEAGLANVLVSAGCVKAANEGRLSLNDPLTKYFPDAQIANAEQITIDQLLYHRSGLRDIVNDTPAEMDELAAWLADVDSGIVLHVSRFFPNWRKRDVGPTPVSVVYDLAEFARKHLRWVYTGNC